MIVNILKKDLKPAHIQDIAINTLALMDEYKVSHLPVIDSHNKFVGLVDETTIMGMDNLQDPLETLRNSCNKVSLLLEAHIFEAIHLFSKNNTTILPIIKQDQYLGYISMSDIIKKIGETTELNTNTSIIIISTINKDYSLNEITRLIEENNGKIMTLWNDFKKDKIDIHLLITCPNSQRIIQALERYDYSITETFVKNSNSSNLDERFESFLKYLNP